MFDFDFSGDFILKSCSSLVFISSLSSFFSCSPSSLFFGDSSPLFASSSTLSDFSLGDFGDPAESVGVFCSASSSCIVAVSGRGSSASSCSCSCFSSVFVFLLFSWVSFFSSISLLSSFSPFCSFFSSFDWSSLSSGWDSSTSGLVFKIWLFSSPFFNEAASNFSGLAIFSSLTETSDSFFDAFSSEEFVSILSFFDVSLVLLLCKFSFLSVDLFSVLSTRSLCIFTGSFKGGKLFFCACSWN